MQRVEDNKSGIYFFIPDGWQIFREGNKIMAGSTKTKIGFFEVYIIAEKFKGVSKKGLLKMQMEKDKCKSKIIENERYAFSECLYKEMDMWVRFWFLMVDHCPVLVRYFCYTKNKNKETDICNQLINSISSINIH